MQIQTKGKPHRTNKMMCMGMACMNCRKVYWNTGSPTEDEAEK